MDIKDKISELGISLNRGQKFLIHEPTVAALVAAGEIDQQHKVVEIGGGLGAITEKLLENTDNVTVIEKEEALSSHLISKFPGAKIINEDALDIDFTEFDRCISNIPFEISSDLIEKLGEAQVQSALIVQDDLADKIVADPGSKDHGYFTVKSQYYFLPVKLRTVSSNCFDPEPEVEAAILKLYPNKDRHNIDNEEEFFSFVKALHTHGKKKTRNALVDARNMLNISKSEAKDIREGIPHKDKRVRQLGIPELKQVFEFYDKKIQ